MQVFIDDDEGYKEWVAKHPQGYVLNAERTPGASYLKLHRANCRTVTGVPARGANWTKDYIKVCSTTRGALDNWAQQKVGGKVSPCGICNPL